MDLYSTLISAKQLAHALASPQCDWVILDCRAALLDPLAGQQAYAAGHIAGAQHADLERHLAAAPQIDGTDGVGGRHPLPTPTQFAKQCAAWGISDDTQVVAYDARDGAFAARAWWLLRSVGHERVAVLDGGLAQWTQALQSVQRGQRGQQANPAIAPGHFSIRPSLTRQVNATDIVQMTNPSTNKGDTPELLDARSVARFEGREEPIDPIAGHIPGARCLPHSGNLDEEGRFLSPAALAVRFAGLATDQTICYCGSGVTATHTILAMRHAGLVEPHLYPGSWSDWIRDPAHPTLPPRAPSAPANPATGSSSH